MKQILLVSILSLICGGLGIAGGWFAGLEKGKSFVQEKEEDHDDHEKPAISEIALENMGIIVGPAKLSSFSKYRTIPAVVEELVTTSQPVFTPVSGHIEKVLVKEYELIKKKQVVVSLIRDAIPRIDLTLTGDILKPATEELHESFAKFRRAVKNLEILEAELQRIQKYSKSEITDAYPILPKKRIIELNYEITRAKQEITITQEELVRHGLSESQIEAGKLGKIPRIDAQIWNRTLKSHGLWPSTAEKLYQVLPEDIQKLHWTMATISELVAAGLVKRDLYMWLKKNRAVGKHFLEIGGLLQRGNSLDKIRHMYDLNAFDSIVKINAPDNADSWDVEEILIKEHQSVEEGQHLITLKNPKHLYLVARPEGSERNLILNALQNNVKVQASPLLEKEGPTLEDLEIENIVSDKKTGAMRAYIQIQNEVFKIHSSVVKRRTWKLRTKQQYILRVPTETMEKVYVFPKDAVTEDGPSKIMFLQNGDHFRPIEVKVLYQDHESVVISNKADIFPGDIVVYQGAFALGLALKSSSGADAGHGHGHGH
ncbi:hypothetical protein [Candidatus Uabimicrobium amorphum]|uniref:Hemolysin D n=1 Tax=Uabimicrobium amorphum TaxID=2596890 RepID=A0A5S9IPE3_UABAM|nr:hypothetical protein [Candidatus Uabimicrobium amorphum]BBM84255.1 hemolysin D [Candidatus Uabimicrobium amorphum]